VETGDDIEFPDYLVDSRAKDLIKRLIVADPEKRLANPSKIKMHPWFENFEFVIFLSDS